ncbi:hypothetical protein JW859_07685 [bacterium]|nr:hypothetical protein [bacterium]
MGSRISLLIVLFILVMSALCACGGGQSLDLNADDGAVLGITQQGGGLPTIPLDRVASEGNGDPDGGDMPLPVTKVEVLGKDYLLMNNGTVNGDALDLEVPTGDADLAWAIYRISDLGDIKPLSLTVEVLPGEWQDEYYIGVANYSKLTWDWFGPSTLLEYEIQLAETDDRYITNLGNLYFIIVVEPDNLISHVKSTLICGPYTSPVPPGAPYGLEASDGLYEEMIELTWDGGTAAAGFEIWRTTDAYNEPGRDGGNPTDPDNGWMLIGESPDRIYLDGMVAPGVEYWYKVRAFSSGGVSEFSNLDSGFALEGPPPPELTIDGYIAFEDDNRVPDVEVLLMTPFGEQYTTTDDEGCFVFEGLIPGDYVVAPFRGDLRFWPEYRVVLLDYDSPVGEVGFTAYTDSLPLYRGWGFTYACGCLELGDNPDADGGPLGGVTVTLADNEGATWVTESNEAGFWSAPELPAGTYSATPSKDGYSFPECLWLVTVDGSTVPEPLPMYGYLDWQPPGYDGMIVGIANLPDTYDGGTAYLVGLSEVVETPVLGGEFCFDNLPNGYYLVTLWHPQLDFTPAYIVVELEGEAPVASVEFTGVAATDFAKFHGFLFYQDWEINYAGVGGIDVYAYLDNLDGETTVAVSDEAGYFNFTDMDSGDYIVIPQDDYWAFYPTYQETGVGGSAIPAPLFFYADDYTDGGPMER